MQEELLVYRIHISKVGHVIEEDCGLVTMSDFAFLISTALQGEAGSMQIDLP